MLPMRIVGLFEVKQAGKKFARPGKILCAHWAADKVCAGQRSRADRAGVAERGGSFVEDRCRLQTGLCPVGQPRAAVPHMNFVLWAKIGP